MICEHCKQRHATVTITQIQNDSKFERHFCEVCAPQFHPFQYETPKDEPVSIQQLISNWFGTPLGNQTSKADQQKTPVACPNCGFTYRQFLKVGKFGCPTCYETFRQQLPSVLQKLQADIKHTGTKQKDEQVLFKIQEQILDLKEKLKFAVSEERFEDAVKFRDAIKALEHKLSVGGVDGQ